MSELSAVDWAALILGGGLLIVIAILIWIGLGAHDDGPRGAGGWTCHVCGVFRPDHLIAVYTAVVDADGVEVKLNVRYCVDDPVCVEGAAGVAERWAEPWVS